MLVEVATKCLMQSVQIWFRLAPHIHKAAVQKIENSKYWNSTAVAKVFWDQTLQCSAFKVGVVTFASQHSKTVHIHRFLMFQSCKQDSTTFNLSLKILIILRQQALRFCLFTPVLWCYYGKMLIRIWFYCVLVGSSSDKICSGIFWPQLFYLMRLNPSTKNWTFILTARISQFLKELKLSLKPFSSHLFLNASKALRTLQNWNSFLDLSATLFRPLIQNIICFT